MKHHMTPQDHTHQVQQYICGFSSLGSISFLLHLFGKSHDTGRSELGRRRSTSLLLGVFPHNKEICFCSYSVSRSQPPVLPQLPCSGFHRAQSALLSSGVLCTCVRVCDCVCVYVCVCVCMCALLVRHTH